MTFYTTIIISFVMAILVIQRASCNPCGEYDEFGNSLVRVHANDCVYDVNNSPDVLVVKQPVVIGNTYGSGYEYANGHRYGTSEHDKVVLVEPAVHTGETFRHNHHYNGRNKHGHHRQNSVFGGHHNRQVYDGINHGTLPDVVVLNGNSRSSYENRHHTPTILYD
ncbi:Hypothetical protein CINCED_3A010563 [Cinara cedri]|uniref:Uncharacterized protein n=1 Tax=Cinara cedri TaxID=506608 RepID=A0A5E4MKJ4_9HEMI|nr:Hypothetical protein CINCED_3A010563 [Cinara cedri]